MFKSLLVLLSWLSFFTGCTSESKTEQSTSPSTSALDTLTSHLNRTVPNVVGLEGEGIVLHQGPGESTPKIVNQKATEALHKTQYCEVDYTVKVEVLASSGTWSQIRVIEPDWLTDSHQGWIPTKYLLSGLPDSTPPAVLKPTDYQILRTKQNSVVSTYSVLLTRKPIDERSLYEFVRSFRAQHCSTNCNVEVYDSRLVVPYLDEYPLTPAHYLLVADHLLSISSFDAPDVRDWYPFQDVQYRRYGGKNWKKKPVR